MANKEQKAKPSGKREAQLTLKEKRAKKAEKKIAILSKLLAEEKPVSTAEEIPELERSNEEMVEAIEEFDAAIYALMWWTPAPDAISEKM